MSVYKCKTCDNLGTVTSPDGRVTSVCRGDYPKAYLIPGPDNSGLQAITIWPQVDPEIEHCGKWLKSSESCDQ